MRQLLRPAVTGWGPRGSSTGRTLSPPHSHIDEAPTVGQCQTNNKPVKTLPCPYGFYVPVGESQGGSVADRPFSDSTAHAPALSTLSSLLGTWLDKYPEDFVQTGASPCLKLLVGYAQVHLPGSALEHHTEILLLQMSHPEPTEADPKAHLSAPDLEMPPEQTVAPISPSAADTGKIPKADLAPSPPPPLPMEVAHIATLQVEPAPSPDGAPAARLEEVTSPSASQVPAGGDPTTTSSATYTVCTSVHSRVTAYFFTFTSTTS
nr:ral guanine nucleotide dissociation stimulator-like [Dasypus novemcinctus]